MRKKLTEEQKAGKRAANKRWRKKNPEKVSEQQKKFRQKNKESLYAQQRKWVGENKEKVQAYQRNYGRKWDAENRQKRRDWKNKRYSTNGATKNSDAHFRSKYGITLSERDQMAHAQNMECLGCEVSFWDVRPCVDHDHKTGAVRGILCWHCNALLGQARDNPATLRRLTAYLERGDQ